MNGEAGTAPPGFPVRATASYFVKKKSAIPTT
jgi:hypothetical protein